MERQHGPQCGLLLLGRTLVARRPSPVAFLAPLSPLGALPLPALPPLPDLIAADDSETLRPTQSGRDTGGGAVRVGWATPAGRGGAAHGRHRKLSCAKLLVASPWHGVPCARQGRTLTTAKEWGRFKATKRGALRKGGPGGQGSGGEDRGEARQRGQGGCSRQAWRKGRAHFPASAMTGLNAPSAPTWSSAGRACAGLGGAGRGGVLRSACCNWQSKPIFAPRGQLALHSLLENSRICGRRICRSARTLDGKSGGQRGLWACLPWQPNLRAHSSWSRSSRWPAASR